MSLLRFAKTLRFRLFYWLLTRRGIPLVTRGGVCQWTFCDQGLGPASTVFCAGAGNDISFEKALIQDYGCRIVLFDPSPTGIATVRKAGLPAAQLQFEPLGLAGHDGVLRFEAPKDPVEGSFRAEPGQGAAALEFPCRSLASLFHEFQWQQIDLLKMDIEGCEYSVIQSLLEQKLNVRQFCVEFHYGPSFGHARSEMVRAILALRRAGYDLVHRVNQDHTFLRRL